MGEVGANFTPLLATYGLVAIFVIMLLKEIGLPIPIPGDLIMLVTAAQAAAGSFHLWQGFAALLVAAVVGGATQYVLVRRLGRPFIDRFGRYIGLTPPRIDAAAATIRKGGVPAVIASLTTPGVRIATVPACGLAEMPFTRFLVGALVGSAVFIGWHFALGYIGGPLVGAALGALKTPVVAFVLAFLIVGLAGWLLLRRRNRAGQVATDATAESLGDWVDACCPVCLAIGATQRLRTADSTG